MNMKKTLAAIAAASVAVSAMATTVSALDPITYNLVDHFKIAASAHTAVFNATVNDAVTGTAGNPADANTKNFCNYIKFTKSGSYTKVKSATISVHNGPGGLNQDRTWTFSTDSGSINYNKNLTNDGLYIPDELLGYVAGTNINISVEMETTYDEISKVNGDIITIKGYKAYDPTKDNATVNFIQTNELTTTITYLQKYTKAEEKVKEVPFKTYPNGGVDIIGYLEGKDGSRVHSGGVQIDKDGHYYQNVKAVLNDAIENYDVTFTFNTATKPVVYTLPDHTYDNKTYKLGDFTFFHKQDAWTDGAVNWSEGMAHVAAAKFSEDQIVAMYHDSWGGDDTYLKFGQHLYTNYYNPENTGFLGYAWSGQNLFAGALVVNEQLTMSLANVEYFDWTETSLSFDWDAVVSESVTNNSYAQYLSTMKLATSSVWYWDNMTVSFADREADDVEMGAGATADENELGDDGDDSGDEIDGDDEDPADDIDDGDDGEEPAPAPEPEPEPAPAPAPVQNPVTGNASVALAVIPVALAAAAIVAKKRG